MYDEWQSFEDLNSSSMNGCSIENLQNIEIEFNIFNIQRDRILKKSVYVFGFFFKIENDVSLGNKFPFFRTFTEAMTEIIVVPLFAVNGEKT